MPESLDEFARTDLLFDALAQRRPVDVEDPEVDALSALLEDWRDNLRWPPASALVSPEEAVNALRDGLAERRRSRRGVAAIGSVAAALLVLSGFGAMVVEARPGDALYGLHAMFFDQQMVNQKQIMVSAKADLARVQDLINRGQWNQAQNQLGEVSSMVQSIDDTATKQDLSAQVDLLNAKIEARNPNATLPPPAASSAPSEPATQTDAPSWSSAPSSAPPAPTTSTSPSRTWSKHHHHGQPPPSVTPSGTG